MTTTFMTLDSRKRISLAAFSPRETYKVTTEASGRILLEPAAVFTEDEIRALSSTETWQAVERSAQSTERRPRRRLSE